MNLAQTEHMSRRMKRELKVLPTTKISSKHISLWIEDFDAIGPTRKDGGNATQQSIVQEYFGQDAKSSENETIYRNGITSNKEGFHTAKETVNSCRMK